MLLDLSRPALTRFILLYKVVSISYVCAMRTVWFEPQNCLPDEETANTLACRLVTSDRMLTSLCQFKIWFTARSIDSFDS